MIKEERYMLRFTVDQNENLLQWALWLDSTPLQQCQQRLYNGEGHCCLGVWLQYYHNPQWVKGEMADGRSGYYAVYNDMRSSFYELNKSDQDRLGIYQTWRPHELGYGRTLHRCFQVLNDQYNYTFSMIADEIYSLLFHGRFTEVTHQKLASTV